MRRYRDIEFTPREWIISIIIFTIMIGLGFLFSNSIHDSISTKNEKYFKSLKVKDSEMFQYAFDTNIGHFLAEGTFKATSPVSHEDIDGKYFYILQIEEHYVEKTRTESYQCGEDTCTRTVTYWEWDEYDRDSFHTDGFTFLDKEFDYSSAKFSNTKYKDTVSGGYHKRFIYYTIPTSFDGSFFGYASQKGVSNTDVFANKNIAEVMEKKEKQADNTTIVFWVIWVLFSIIIVVIFMSLENRYLNGHS